MPLLVLLLQLPSDDNNGCDSLPESTCPDVGLQTTRLGFVMGLSDAGTAE